MRGVTRPTPFLASLSLTLLVSACSTFGSANGDTPDAAGPTGTTPEGGTGTLDGGYPPLRVTLVSPIAPVVRGRAPIVAEVKVEPLGVDAEVLVDGLPPGSPKTFAGVNRATGIAKIPIEVPAGTKPGEYPVVLRATSAGTPSKGDLSVKIRVRGAPGEIDETFGVAGRAIEPAATFGVQAATLVEGGKIVLSGKDEMGPLLRRFNADGSRDTTFGDQGAFRAPGIGIDHLLQTTSGLRAIPSSLDETIVYRFDAAGKATPLRTFPSGELVQILSFTTATANRLVLTGTRNDGRWVLASLDVDTGLLSNWGTGGFVHDAGTSWRAFGFFEETSSDHAFVQHITPEEVVDVTLDKSGNVVGKTTIPGVTRLPFKVVRLGPMDYVFVTRDYSSIRWKGGQATPFTPALTELAASSGNNMRSRFFKRSGGFLLLAEGVESMPLQFTGSLFLKVCLLNDDGKPTTSFGISGCQKLELSPQNPTPHYFANAALLSEDESQVTIVGTFAATVSTVAIGMTRMWL